MKRNLSTGFKVISIFLLCLQSAQGKVNQKPSIQYPETNRVLIIGTEVSGFIPTTKNIKSFSITPELPTNSGLMFNSTNGELSGTPLTRIKRTNFTVVGTGVYSGTAKVKLSLEALDAAPKNFSYNSGTLYLSVGEELSPLPAQITGTNLNFTVKPKLLNGLLLDPTNGTIYGVAKTATSSILTYEVTAKNSGGVVSTNLSLQVIKRQPKIAYKAQYRLKIAKSVSIVPVKFSDVDKVGISPQLPRGLLLNDKTGVISGIAEEVLPAQEFFVSATNKTSKAVKNTKLIIEIIDIPPKNLKYGTPFIFEIGKEVNEAPSSTGGKITDYSISPVLPAGLSIDPLSGLIFGNPQSDTGRAEYFYTVTASNSGGSTNFVLSLTINQPLPTFSYSSSDVENDVGDTVYLNPTGSGFTTVSVEGGDGNLPQGLSLDSNTGVVSGTLGNVANTIIKFIISNATGQTITQLVHFIITQASGDEGGDASGGNDDSGDDQCLPDGTTFKSVSQDGRFKDNIDNNCHDYSNNFCNENPSSGVFSCIGGDSTIDVIGHTLNWMFNEESGKMHLIDPQTDEVCSFDAVLDCDESIKIIDLDGFEECAQKQCGDQYIHGECVFQEPDFRALTFDGAKGFDDSRSCANQSGGSPDECNTCCENRSDWVRHWASAELDKSLEEINDLLCELTGDIEDSTCAEKQDEINELSKLAKDAEASSQVVYDDYIERADDWEVECKASCDEMSTVLPL